MKLAHVIWKFSRPHTIIGSAISISTLFLIASEGNSTFNWPLLILSLIVGITCNIFIVGINQVADVNIDKINKPYLPIPAGVLTEKKARQIVWWCLGISLAVGLYISPYLFIIVALSTGIGWAYSMPPLYLKKHHLTSAIAISTVRGVLLNAGGFLLFNKLLNGRTDMPKEVQILTLFVIAFSVVISWFKDLSDIEGDKKYNIKTLAIQFSAKHVLILGNILVGLAYIFTIYTSSANRVLYYGHFILMGLFILNAFTIKLSLQDSVRKYYKRFWWFFFAEYLLYFIAYL